MANVTAMRGDNIEFRCKVGNLGKHMVCFCPFILINLR